MCSRRLCYFCFYRLHLVEDYVASDFDKEFEIQTVANRRVYNFNAKCFYCKCNCRRLSECNPSTQYWRSNIRVRIWLECWNLESINLGNSKTQYSSDLMLRTGFWIYMVKMYVGTLFNGGTYIWDTSAFKSSMLPMINLIDYDLSVADSLFYTK